MGIIPQGLGIGKNKQKRVQMGSNRHRGNRSKTVRTMGAVEGKRKNEIKHKNISEGSSKSSKVERTVNGRKAT